MRTTTMGLTLALVAGLTAGRAAAQTFAEPKLFEVTATALNVHADHSTSAQIVKVLKKHQALWVIAKWNNWKQIKSPVQGWVHEDYVRFGLKRFVTASELNVRSSASTSASVKKVLKKGAEVRVVDLKKDWRQIDKPVSGWVASKYLSSQKPGSGGGSVNVGSTNSHGFAQLPSSATGIFWYCPYSTHHWGVPRIISKILTMGRQWAPHRIGSGDISLPYGGYFPPHATHQDGRAADFEPMTTSGSGGATSVGYSSYSTYYNQKFVNLMYSTPVSVAFVLHNNSRISRVQYCAGHYNHLHMAVY